MRLRHHAVNAFAPTRGDRDFGTTGGIVSFGISSDDSAGLAVVMQDRLPED